MNLEAYRKRIALEGELSRVESKFQELNLLVAKDYFAEFRIEGRVALESDYMDENLPKYRNPKEAIVSQSLFEDVSYSIWNDLCRKFIVDMKELLEVRKIEIEESLQNL